MCSSDLVEKFVFGLIALLTAGLMYLGFSTKGFDTNKDPKKLSDKAGQVLNQIREPHWDSIKNEEPRVKGVIDVSYAEKSTKSTQLIPKDLYRPEIPIPGSRATGFRTDPEILAPRALEAGYYFGPLVVGNANPQVVDFWDKLANAKEKEEPRRREPRGGSGPDGEGSGPGLGRPPGGGAGPGGRPPSGGGPPPGMGRPPSGGGPPPGLGFGGGPGLAATNRRYMSAAYDRGFPSHTLGQSNPNDPKRKSIGPRDIGFVAVTALAPHEELEKEYRAKLLPGGNLMPGRDTPNYVEIGRAHV